jgi:hypothetical protein
MPTGPSRWDMSRCWYFYPGGWYDLYYIEMDGTDTIIGEETYKKLYHTTRHAPGTEFDSTYTHFLGGMREEGKQVFMVSEFLCLDTIERMIYDFNETFPGDTIYTQVLTNGLTQFVPHIVTSVDDVLVDGTSHRRINVRDENSYFYESWIEGVGSIQGLVYASYWLLTDNSYDLHCFYDGNELAFINDAPGFSFCTPPYPEVECDPVITSPGPGPQPVVVTLYPNPLFTTLHIESTVSFERIEVYTMTGVSVMDVPFIRDLECSHLPAGMYVLRLMTGGEEEPVVEKVIKL